MTTVPGASSGTSTFSAYAAKAGPFIAPLMTPGAIMASAVSPAMNGTVLNFVPWRLLLGHGEAVFEHDGELAFGGVPSTHRSLPLD